MYGATEKCLLGPKRDAVHFQVLASSNFGRLKNLECFCPYLSISVLDCFSLLFFLFEMPVGIYKNGVQLPSITILSIPSGTYISLPFMQNALAYVLNRYYGITICQFYSW